jgi:hypothetical protein
MIKASILDRIQLGLHIQQICGYNCTAYNEMLQTWLLFF